MIINYHKMMFMKGCASCPMASECYFAGEAIVVPQECVDCVGSAMDRIEKENKALDDAVDVMRQDINDMEVEMKKFDERMETCKQEIQETAKIFCEKPMDFDALARKYDEMLEKIKRTVV
jgi:peptidoglycan hydrolase CwlO-like protein